MKKRITIQKMTISEALIRFRNELAEVSGLSSSERIRLMEEFKFWFNRSLDYDLASDRIMDQILPAMSRSKSQNSFKSFWKEMNTIDKGLLDFFRSEESKARRMIDEEFQSGKREVDVLNSLLLSGQSFFGRPLSQKEIDKLRFLVISEKVRLNNDGVKITN